MHKFFLSGVGTLAALAMLGCMAVPGHAAPTMAGPLKQVPADYRFTVGDAEVAAFSDCTIPIDLHKVLTGVTPAEIDALLASNFLSNPMETSINVFMIKQKGRHILVDTGMGDPDLPGRCGRMFDSMAAVGVRPDQIDDIVITHLHLDHIGGLFWGGKMKFPNATIHISKPELDQYLGPRPAADARARQINALTMSILKPYLDAGKVKTFTQSGEVLPGLYARILPGHTAGSTLYTLNSGGQEIVFIGDYNPVPPVGFRHPDVTFVTDQDRPKSGAARREMLSELSRTGALVAAPHLSFPGIGHVGADGDAYRWYPIEHSNRDADLPEAKF